LPPHEPRGEDPDDRHEQREGSNCRRRVARYQPVPDAVAKERRDDDDVRRERRSRTRRPKTSRSAAPGSFAKTSDSPSNGTGAATLDQTSSERGRFGLAARVTTFPQPHDAADATPNATA